MTSRLPTITDVARRAGVSTASVSRVLNASDQVSDRLRTVVQSAIRDVGYVPNAAARSLRMSGAGNPYAVTQGTESQIRYGRGPTGHDGLNDKNKETKKEEGARMKGPAIFLAQFMSDQAPFNSLPSIAGWAAGHGYTGVQLPTIDPAYIDLARAAESRDYCDELKGICAEQGVEITELSTHLQGQLVAVHPAYDAQFDGFAPAAVHGNPKARTEWAIEQMKLAAKASANFDLGACVSFSGSLAFPYLYPWPQRPEGLMDEAFGELARRWGPIFDAYEDAGVDVAFELHPGEDLFDGASYEMLLDRVGGHSRCCINYDPSHFLLQQMDYLAFIDIYHERIKAFHVKDAEFNPTGKQGVYSGYQGWTERAGRFRSLGDGQVDFVGIFSKLAQYGYDSWAVLEWECCLKHPEQGAAEGAPFIADHIIQLTDTAFDDFADSGADRVAVRRMLGLE